ncbi:hypothetical protein HK102_007087, partial [Quaeritorhiza haematococci]
SKKEEAEDYIRCENMVTKNKNLLYQIGILECSKNKSVFEDALTTLQQRMAEEMQSTEELKRDVDALQKNRKATEKAYEEIAAKAEKVRKELQKFERNEVQLKEQEKHLKQKQKKLTKTLHTDKLSKSEHETWMNNYTSDLEKLQKEADELAEQLKAEEKELERIGEGLRDKTQVFQTQIEQNQKDLAPWLEKLNAKKSQIDVARSEVELLKKKTTQAKEALREAEEGLERLEGLRREKERGCKQLKQEKEQVLKRIQELERMLENVNKEDAAMKKSLLAARQKADETKMALQAMESRGNVHRALMQQSQLGRIKGICGRLGDLGIIDSKYDVAVTTACGSLENIVVDTVEVGQACIAYLKTHNLGRATFICLDKLRNWDVNPIETPENVPRLFDLITFREQRFAPAFYQVLQDTLVANDLQQANRIAYGKRRFRVVTLDGKVIDVSGTMSGGGNKVQRGGMASKFIGSGSSSSSKSSSANGGGEIITKEHVAQLERERDLLEAKLKAVQDQRKQIEAEITQLSEQRIQALDLEISKSEMDLSSVVKQIADAEKLVNDLKHQDPVDERDLARIKELEKTIQNHTRELEQTLQPRVTKIETVIHDLQEKILQVGGVKFRSQKAKVDDVQGRIDTTNERITRMAVERNTREKGLGKLVKGIEKKEVELREIEEELEGKVVKELEELRGKSEEVRAKVDEAKELLSAKEDELEEIKKEVNEKTERLNELRRIEFEHKTQIDEAKKNLQGVTEMMKKYQADLAKLSLQKTGLDDDEDDEELEEYEPEELENVDRDVLKRETQELEAKLKKRNPNLLVLQEYKEKYTEYLNLVADLDKCTKEREEAKERYDALKKKRLDEFMVGFTAISQKLKEMYQMITLGGNAELELVDSLDPFSEGILFSVMPPKKSWKNISNLSGGEKVSLSEMETLKLNLEHCT